MYNNKTLIMKANNLNNTTKSLMFLWINFLLVIFITICGCKKEIASTDELPKDFGIPIYAVGDVDEAQTESVLSNPNVTGFFIRVSWQSVEPEENQFDWTFIDNEMSKAVAYGKKVSIGIIAGDLTPHWQNNPFTFLDFKIIPHDGDGHARWTSIPIPWETPFLNAYTNLIKALKEHLSQKASFYNVVSIIKICGINQETAETRLPYEDSTYVEGIDTASNAPAIWIANGYTQNKVYNAWKYIAEACQENFPDKDLDMAIIPDPNGFPAIDNMGKLILENLNTTTNDLVKIAANQYGNKIIVQYNSFHGYSSKMEDLIDAQNLGAKIAYQENKAQSDKTFHSVEETIMNAKNQGAQFIELFNATIENNL